MSELGWNRAYVSLGSNIRPELGLPAAARMLAMYGRVLAVSQVWESAPFGNAPSGHDRRSPNFLNAAVLIETLLSANGFCSDAAPTIEARLGRVRDPRDKNAPRTIDVDLSLWNHETLTVGHRTIPDPDILTRVFVAVPLAELDPDYVHPTANKTLGEIAEALGATSDLRLREDVSLR